MIGTDSTERKLRPIKLLSGRIICLYFTDSEYRFYKQIEAVQNKFMDNVEKLNPRQYPIDSGCSQPQNQLQWNGKHFRIQVSIYESTKI